MNKGWIKRGMAIVLSAAMVLGVMPQTGLSVADVQAAEDSVLPDAYFLDLSSRKLTDKATAFSGYNLAGTGRVGKIRFGKNGNDAREWLIAGDDGENTLGLLSRTEFGKCKYGDIAIYGDDDTTPQIKSKVLTYLEDCMSGTEYFSAKEKSKSLMKDTTVKTIDVHGIIVRTVTRQLYLPDAADEESYGYGNTSFYVGSGDTKKRVSSTCLPANGCSSNIFWLRSPYFSFANNYAMVVYPGSYVLSAQVDAEFPVIPAFALNLSSAVFASAALPATTANVGTSKALTTKGRTYTLRYAPAAGSDLTSVKAVYDSSSVTVSNAKAGMYLVVQKDSKAYAVPVDESTDSVSVSSITGDALTSLDNCKIWIESTDEDRITSAVMVKKSTAPYTVALINSSNEIQYFLDIHSAVAAAHDGDTVKLLENLSDVSDLIIDKDIILDLDDNSITTESDYDIDICAKVTIATGENGLIKCFLGTPHPIENNGTLVVTGHGMDCVVVNQGTISGGTFNKKVISQTAGSLISGGVYEDDITAYGMISGGYFAGNVKTYGKGEVTGGYFTKKANSNTGDGIKAGYVWVENTDSETKTKYPYKVIEITYEDLTKLINTTGTQMNLYAETKTTASVNTLTSAYEEAQKIKETAEREDIAIAYNNLRNAVNGLVNASATLALSSTPENAGILTGGGKYAAEDVVKISAKAVKGYTFEGWYKGTDVTGDPDITETSFTYTIKDGDADIDFTAKYTANANQKLTIMIGNGTVDYSYNQTTGTWSNDLIDNTFAKGTCFTVTAKPDDSHTFLYWIDTNTNKILTSNKSYSFYLSDNVKLKACYRMTEAATHYVIFKDLDGKILWSGDVEDGAAATDPGHGTFTGYEFVKWDKNFDSVKEDLVINAEYTKQSGYTVSTDGGTIDGPKESYTYGDLVTVHAEETKESKHFSGWYVGDTKVSDNIDYSFYVVGNTSLTAKYEGDTVIVPEPMLNLTVSDRTTLDNGKQTIQYNNTWAVPEGYSVMEAGLVFTFTDALKENLTLEKADNSTIYKRASTLTTEEGTYAYTMTLGTNSKAKNVNAVGYLTYVHDATGEIITKYTSLYTSNAN